MPYSHLLMLLFVCFSLTIQAQETEKGHYLWPVEGKETGEDILYRPQDYIENEHNFGRLFVTAAENTNILSPCNGVVLSFGYDYYMSLNTTRSFGGESLNEVAGSVRGELAKRGIDAKYLAASIYLQAEDGKRISIMGLDTENRKFVTGQKVKRGDVLGKIHYCYKNIPQHCIILGVDTRDGKVADPMTPFGLKSTFVPPVVKQPKQRLTRAEATADYRQLAASVKEIYPSLDDLMSETEYDAFVEAEIAKLPETISLPEFARRMMDFNRKIHDSHIWFTYGISTERHRDAKFPPVWLSKFNDDGVRVVLSTEKYRSYRGREITHINGRHVDTICVEMERYFNHVYDADVQSVKEQDMAEKFTWYYYTMAEEAQKEGRTTFTFANGEELTVALEDHRILSKYERIPPENAENTPPFGKKIQGKWYTHTPNDSTAYLRLKSFSLMDSELEDVLAFIGGLEANGIKNLIIDLRGNPGGYPHVLYKMVEAVMDEPILHEGGYQKVNAQSFKSGTLNLVSGEPMFDAYKPVEGKKGFYLYPNDNPAAEDTARHQVYKGRIYVLVNGRSASASATFAGIMKRNKRGYIVGRETMTAYHRMNAVKFADIQLANSLFQCHIPMVRFVSDEYVSHEFPYGRGVIPHLTIPISYEAMTTKPQLIYTKTMELIANGIYLVGAAS